MKFHVIITLVVFSVLPVSLHSYAKSLLSSSNYSSAVDTALSNNTAPWINTIRLATTKAIDESLLPFSGSVILLNNGLPVLALQKGNAISPDSSFVIASLSKQITATLILQAVDAGKLDLHRSLNSYLFDDVTRDKNKRQDGIETNSDQSGSSFILNRYDERNRKRTFKN